MAAQINSRHRSRCVVALRWCPQGQVDLNCTGAAEVSRSLAIVVSLLELSRLFWNLPCKESDPLALCPLFTSTNSIWSSDTDAGLWKHLKQHAGGQWTISSVCLRQTGVNIRTETLGEQVRLFLLPQKGMECKLSFPFSFPVFVFHQRRSCCHGATQRFQIYFNILKITF